MTLLEFVKSYIPKSVAIVQTDLCSADLEMLFTSHCKRFVIWRLYACFRKAVQNL